MSASLPPSGRQFEISSGQHRVVAVEVGGALRTYTVDGRQVIDGYPIEKMCDGARGQTLVPWPNRVKDGAWSWRGSDYQLALTEPEQHNAIHGLVRWLPWTCLDHSAAEVTLQCTSYPQPGYPWPLRVTNRYALDADGLAVTTSITNLGDSAAPVASGAHPYLTVGTTTIDDAVLHLPAETWIDTGPQQIPTEVRPVAGSPWDFREPRVLGDTVIDYAFGELARDADGLFRLRLSSDDGGAAASLWLSEAYPYVEIFTGDALPDAGRRRRGLGVEPMSAPPNALASGESLVVLEPGEEWSGRWGIEPR